MVVGAFGRMNLPLKVLRVALDINWKLALMHTSVQGVTSTMQAALLGSSANIGSRISISSAQFVPGILSTGS